MYMTAAAAVLRESANARTSLSHKTTRRRDTKMSRSCRMLPVWRSRRMEELLSTPGRTHSTGATWNNWMCSGFQALTGRPRRFFPDGEWIAL